MRLQDKIAINNMRLEGHSPSVIAAKFGLPAGTVRSHIYRHPNIPGARACKNCGRPLMQPKGRREKKVLLRFLPDGMVERPPGECQQKSLLPSYVPALWKGV